jgi:integrase
MKRNKGIGRIYQPSYRDRKTGELRYSPTWWIALSHRGKRIQLSSNSDKRADAVKLLKQKLAELGAGRPVGPDVDKTTFADLCEILTDNYKANGRKSVPQLKSKFDHLREAFGMDLARDITSDRITKYVARRLDERAKNSTINRELAALKRAFRLAHRAGRVASLPHIDTLHENNARKGFFEREQFNAVLRYLSGDLRPVVHAAYLTGWRVQSELLSRRRQHVDLKDGWLRLEPGETKNGEGRNFPLTAELRTVLEEQIARTRELEVATGQIIPWLFHRDGKPIKDFRHAWKTACRAAGVRRPKHDFRRTAVRNLERMGISRSAAMKMVGHKTESIYRRYAIADEVALKEAAAKIDAAGQMSAESPGTFAKARLKQAPAASSGGN